MRDDRARRYFTTVTFRFVMLYEGIQVSKRVTIIIRLVIGYLHFEGRMECPILACKIRSKEVGCVDAPIGNA